MRLAHGYTNDSVRDGTIVTKHYRPGRHGQELIDAGHAARVLLLCGSLLRQIQSLSPQLLPAGVRAGPVLVHGDFGPQNLLVAPNRWRVAALLDWEWVHHG